MGKTSRRNVRSPWGLGVNMKEKHDKPKSEQTLRMERENDLLRKKIAKQLKK